MRCIDANTGIEFQKGSVFKNVNGVHEVVDIDRGVFSARALVKRDGGAPTWVPLIVRFTHPSYFARWIAFFPS